jgi:uncharacterized protein (TIGR03382 family)
MPCAPVPHAEIDKPAVPGRSAVPGTDVPEVPAVPLLAVGAVLATAFVVRRRRATV